MGETIEKNLVSNSRSLPNIPVTDNVRPLSANEIVREEARCKSNPLGISWYLFIPLLAMTCMLLMPYGRALFVDAGFRWAYVLLLAFGISFSMNPVFSKISFKLNILDCPDRRKLHREATPVLGGAAVFSGFLAALLINGIFTLELGAILVSSMILFIVGVMDDCKEMAAGVKLLAQVISGTLVIICGIVLRVLPLDMGLFAHTGNVLLTLIWIVGITNAMNFFDGMDGLAAGLGVLISFFLGVVAFQTAQPFIGWIAVAMMGSCLGFLPYNFKIKGHASIFLGDAGSTVIGFILASLAVYGDWAEGNPIVALISPILIFWILIFDMVHITFDRILTGRVMNFRQWIEYVGNDHLHHRLANILGGNKKSVLFIYLLSVSLGLSSVALRNARVVDAVLLILQATIFVILITFLERRGRLQKSSLGSKIDSGVAEVIR